MAIGNLQNYLSLIPSLKKLDSHLLYMSYDEEADTLYINFKKPSIADDSELTDDDIIIRYEKEQVVGLTILNAGKRKNV